MSAKKDGGPAFPCPVGHIECAHPEGMSLRDYFAAKAMCGVLVGRNHPVSSNEELAAACYTIADAMIEARKMTR